MLCFGVYSAMTVTYTVNGSVSYELDDVLVKITLSVYRSTSTSPLTETQNSSNVTAIQSAATLPVANTECIIPINPATTVSTYNPDTGEIIEPDDDFGYSGLNLAYGSPSEEDKGYAFYIVLDITNYAHETINAVVSNTLQAENTNSVQSKNINIDANSANRIVIGLAVDDVTHGIINGDFSYNINIDQGEIAEPTLYSVGGNEEVVGASGYKVAPYGTQNVVDLTSGSAEQTEVSSEQVSGPYVTLAKYSIENLALFQSADEMIVTTSVPSSETFMFALILQGIYYNSTEALDLFISIGESSNEGSIVIPNSVVGYYFPLEEPVPISSVDLNIDPTKFADSSHFTVCLYSVAEISSVTLSNLKVYTASNNLVSLGELPVDDDMIVKARNAIELKDSRIPNVQILVFNYKIENFYSMAPYFSFSVNNYDFDDYIFIVRGNINENVSFEDIYLWFVTGTGPTYPELPLDEYGGFLSTESINSYFNDGTLEFAVVALAQTEEYESYSLFQIGFRTSDWIYTLNDDNATYTAEYNGTLSKITVPTEYNGNVVTGFRISTPGMGSIIVPEGITDVYINNATLGSTGVNELSIPTTIESFSLVTPSGCFFYVNVKVNLNNLDDWNNAKYDSLKSCFEQYSDYYLVVDLYVDGSFVQNVYDYSNPSQYQG